MRYANNYQALKLLGIDYIRCTVEKVSYHETSNLYFNVLFVTLMP